MLNVKKLESIYPKVVSSHQASTIAGDTMPEFTNDHGNLTARLMGLFPVDRIKKEYDQKGNSDTVYAEIAKQHTLKDLEEDACRLFGHARQHCFFFPHKEKDLANHHTDFIKKELIHKKNVQTQDKDSIVVEYLLGLHYDFLEVVNRTADTKKLKYFWPIKVIMHEKVLELRMVIMEKFMKSTDRFFYRGREIEEQDVVAMVANSTGTSRFDQPLDLNKGIKSLWDEGVVDATDVSHKSSSSVDRAIMDNGLTYKDTYPERYAKMIKDPLRKLSFYNHKQKDWPALFAVDASLGFLAFTRFQSTVDSIDLFVTELLKRNA